MPSQTLCRLRILAHLRCYHSNTSDSCANSISSNIFINHGGSLQPRAISISDHANQSFMQKGDQALQGIPERNISAHRFPPHPSENRAVQFAGLFLQIYNEKTRHEKTRAENITERKRFEVPKDYTVYVRVVKEVYFEP